MLAKFLAKIRKSVTLCDLFNNPNLLRFKDEPEYKSTTGGFLTIALAVAFVIVFINTFINTINEVNINSQVTQYEETEPSFYATMSSPLLFALGITNLNMNDPNTKYFNVLLSQTTVINGSKTSVSIPLYPCQRSVWVAFDSSLGEVYDRVGLSSWLCPSPSAVFEFQGKYSSDIFKYLKMSVQTCSISKGDNRTCVNSSFLPNFVNANGSLSFNYYFMNTIINAQDNDYLSTYLEDRNYFTFTNTLGTTSNIFISAYQIDTDVSLWPVVQINTDTGGIVFEATQVFPFQVTSTTYIQLYLRKSSLSLSITRSFQKYDDTLSYIGGLFALIVSVLFIINIYNEYSYQIDVGSRVFYYKKKISTDTESFNLLTFIFYLFYCLFAFFGLRFGWKLMKVFDNSRQEMGKQLDVELILKKLIFLEDSTSYLFEDYELKCLHLKGRMDFPEAIKLRKRYEWSRKFAKILSKQKNIQTDNMKQIEMKNENHKDILNLEYDPVVVHPQNSSGMLQLDIPDKTAQSNLYRLEKNEQGMEKDELDSEESQNEEKELEFFQQTLIDLRKTYQQSKTGNRRCKKIWESLEQGVKEVISYNPKKYSREPLPPLNRSTSKISYNFQQVIDVQNA